MMTDVIDTGLKATITYTPTVAEISAFLLAGNGTEALDFSVIQLVGTGVEWELDIVSQSVNIKQSITPAYLWQDVKKGLHSSIVAAGAVNCEYSCASEYVSHYMVGVDQAFIKCTDNGFGVNGASVQRVDNPDYIEPTPPITIDEVSTQILTNAAANHSPSQAALTQITLDKFAADELLIEIEAAAIPFS